MVTNPTPVVLITGPPASGKTTLARALADELKVPLITKDGIKELLYEALGVGDHAWSRKLGVATYSLLFHVLAAELRAGRSVMVEGTFGPIEGSRDLATVHARTPFTALQLYCTAPVPTLMERYAARASVRHPGHVDAQISEDVRTRLLAGDWQPLTLPGTVITVETATFETLDFGDLAARVASHLSGGQST